MPYALPIWLMLGVPLPAASTCVAPPLSTQVSRAVVILDGRVERVVYLQRDGTPEATPKTNDSLCGPKLVTFRMADTEMSRSTRFPGIAPPSVATFVHACGGTRRIRDAKGDLDATAENEGYIADIKRLLR